MPVQQAAKGVERESERGCFSTTSCSRHPQTPLDPGCYIERERKRVRERERERERGGEKARERMLSDHKSPKLASNRPLAVPLFDVRPLRPGYTFTYTCMHVDVYTRRRVGFEGVTRNSVHGHGKKSCHGSTRLA